MYATFHSAHIMEGKMILSRFSTYIRLNDKGFARLRRAGRAGLGASAAFVGMVCTAPPSAQAMCAPPDALPFEAVGGGKAVTRRFTLKIGATSIMAVGDKAGYNEKEPYAIQLSVAKVRGGDPPLCPTREIKAEQGGNFTICQFKVSSEDVNNPSKEFEVEVTATNKGTNVANFTLICVNELGYLSLRP